jgi:hypothetical protein
MTTTLHALLLKLSLLLVSVAAAQATYSVTVIPSSIRPVQVSLIPTSPDAYIRTEAAQKGVNPDFASCIVSHESQDTDRPGDDGNSRGYWQISKIWHPEVSDAVAYSLQSSTLWSLNWIKAGHAAQWSTYGLYCSSTAVFP